MNNDIAGAVNSEPTTTIEIGSVASDGSPAKKAPARPATMMLIASCDPRTACANTSTATLCFARAKWVATPISTVGVLMATSHRGGAPGYHTAKQRAGGRRAENRVSQRADAPHRVHEAHRSGDNVEAWPRA